MFVNREGRNIILIGNASTEWFSIIPVHATNKFVIDNRMNIYSTWFLVEICFTERADDLELQILASRLQSSDGDLGGGWFNIHYPCVTLISRRSNAIPGVFIPGSLPFTLPRDSRSLLIWFSSSEVLLVLSDLNKDKLFHIKVGVADTAFFKKNEYFHWMNNQKTFEWIFSLNECSAFFLNEFFFEWIIFFFEWIFLMNE